MADEEWFHLGVKALIFNDQGELLLLELASKKSKIWDLPGGRMQRGEEPLEALKREVFEETGLLKMTEPLLLSTDLTTIRLKAEGKDCRLIYMTYCCDLIGDEAILLSQEHDRYVWAKPALAAVMFPQDFPENIRRILTKWNTIKPEV